MQFKLWFLAGAAATASAQLTGVDPEVQASVINVLATALPSSVVAEAITNQAGFASKIASSIAAGQTPEWYQALPTDLKSILAEIYPASTPAHSTAYQTASPSVTSAPESSAYETSVPSLPSGTGSSSVGTNSSAITSINSPTLSPSPSGTPPAQATGAASRTSAVFGAGLAAAMGFLGMLVL